MPRGLFHRIFCATTFVVRTCSFFLLTHLLTLTNRVILIFVHKHTHTNTNISCGLAGAMFGFLHFRNLASIDTIYIVVVVVVVVFVV